MNDNDEEKRRIQNLTPLFVGGSPKLEPWVIDPNNDPRNLAGFMEAVGGRRLSLTRVMNRGQECGEYIQHGQVELRTRGNTNPWPCVYCFWVNGYWWATSEIKKWEWGEDEDNGHGDTLKTIYFDTDNSRYMVRWEP